MQKRDYFSKAFAPLFQWLTVLFITLTLSACQLPLFSKPAEKPAPKAEVRVAKNSGFGGTGQVAKTKKAEPEATQVADNSGFGGTGIIGTVTEFGSIWVNGIEIEYPENVEVKSNLFNNDTLKVGQQVMVETVIGKNLPWTANIEVFYPLAGKIEKVNTDHVVVDGKTVFISKETRIADGVKILPGQYIAINGYPNLDKSWNATLISQNPEKKHFFQRVPKVSFSEKLRKLSILTTQTQLKEWDAQFAGLPINLIQTGETSTHTYLLTAELEKGEIVRYQIKQHDLGAVKNGNAGANEHNSSN